MKANEQTWATLLSKARTGDARAYAQLLTELATYLRNYLHPRLTSDQLEDVVQETLLGLHQARHTWRETDPLLPWLHGIARYKLADHFRRSYRVAAHEVQDAHAYETFAAPPANTSGERQDLAKLLATLPPHQQKILHLMKGEGRTAVETGAILGMQATAVKVAVHRVIRKLQARQKELDS